MGGAGALWGRVLSEGSSGSNGTHCSWQRLDDVGGTSAVIDKLEMDSVFVLRVRGCNKAGFGEYSEEVYLHTPPAAGKMHKYTNTPQSEALQNIRDTFLFLQLPSLLVYYLLNVSCLSSIEWFIDSLMIFLPCIHVLIFVDSPFSHPSMYPFIDLLINSSAFLFIFYLFTWHLSICINY